MSDEVPLTRFVCQPDMSNLTLDWVCNPLFPYVFVDPKEYIKELHQWQKGSPLLEKLAFKPEKGGFGRKGGGVALKTGKEEVPGKGLI